MNANSLVLPSFLEEPRNVFDNNIYTDWIESQSSTRDEVLKTWPHCVVSFCRWRSPTSHIRKRRVKTLSCWTSVLKTFTALGSESYFDRFYFFRFLLVCLFFGIETVIMVIISVCNEGQPASLVWVSIFFNEECLLEFYKQANGHFNLIINYLYTARVNWKWMHHFPKMPILPFRPKAVTCRPFTYLPNR